MKTIFLVVLTVLSSYGAEASTCDQTTLEAHYNAQFAANPEISRSRIAITEDSDGFSVFYTYEENISEGKNQIAGVEEFDKKCVAIEGTKKTINMESSLRARMKADPKEEDDKFYFLTFGPFGTNIGKQGLNFTWESEEFHRTSWTGRATIGVGVTTKGRNKIGENTFTKFNMTAILDNRLALTLDRFGNTPIMHYNYVGAGYDLYRSKNRRRHVALLGVLQELQDQTRFGTPDMYGPGVQVMTFQNIGKRIDFEATGGSSYVFFKPSKKKGSLKFKESGSGRYDYLSGTTKIRVGSVSQGRITYGIRLHGAVERSAYNARNVETNVTTKERKSSLLATGGLYVRW